MLIFRQLFDAQSSTYTYLLGDGDSRDAVLIDPVLEQVRRDAALIRDLSLHLRWTLETHVHADHVTGAWLLRQRCGSAIGFAAANGAILILVPVSLGVVYLIAVRHEEAYLERQFGAVYVDYKQAVRRWL